MCILIKDFNDSITSNYEPVIFKMHIGAHSTYRTATFSQDGELLIIKLGDDALSSLCQTPKRIVL